MGKIKKLTKKTNTEIEYDIAYGSIPNTQEERIEYIKEKYKINPEKLDSLTTRIENLGWNELIVKMDIVPKPTPRPRYSTKIGGFYVKGAAENKRIMNKIITNLDIVYTRIDMVIKTYQPIPLSSMKAHEILMAESGLIRPMQNPDWDNLGKTYSDMIQDIVILNDNIIVDGKVEKYFSLKPRVEIIIKYQDGFDSDFNENRITKSTTYKKMVEKKLMVLEGLAA